MDRDFADSTEGREGSEEESATEDSEGTEKTALDGWKRSLNTAVAESARVCLQFGLRSFLLQKETKTTKKNWPQRSRRAPSWKAATRTRTN
jgi:hypothetical protein